MDLWQIEEIYNGYVLTLPQGQKEFYDSWADVLKRLERLKV